jgi:adenosylmethionine-8-amino-7-oxononanoate aminotransferase
MAVKATLLEPIDKHGKNFLHAQTFAHHPVGCAAGLAAIGYLKGHSLVARSDRVGKALMRKLQRLLDHPHVGDVRGKGLLLGVEFVKDKKKKTPFPRGEKYVETFIAEALDRGLVLWPNIGQADGRNGDLVMIAPPFIIQEDEVSEMLEKIEFTLAEMERKFG